jgi:hypothetical protein
MAGLLHKFISLLQYSVQQINGGKGAGGQQQTRAFSALLGGSKLSGEVMPDVRSGNERRPETCAHG